MRMSIVLGVAIILFGRILAAESQLPQGRLSKEEFNKLSPELQREYRQRNIMRNLGGFVIRQGSGAGRFRFVNLQKRLAPQSFANETEKIKSFMPIDIEYMEGTDLVTPMNASEMLAKIKAQAAVFIVDDKSLPSVLVAPESGWGMLNVGALVNDKPSLDVLAKRVRREMWRVFAMTCGSTDTETGHCLLAPVAGIRDLDAIDANEVGPEPYMRIKRHLERFGFRTYVRASYKRACIDGWAPQPTNEFQKAIWERVKSDKERGPTNPIRIEATKK